MVPSFRQQLMFLRSTDIYVTSTGTALFYTLFLPDAAVVVNVGHLLPSGLPAYGEDFLGASNPRVKWWYPEPRQVMEAWASHFKPAVLVRWVETAARLIRQRFRIPIPHPEDNLSPLGAIHRELVQRSSYSYGRLRGLTAKDNSWHCHARRQDSAAGLADVVYEISPTNESCRVDVSMLRRIKERRSLAVSLGIAGSSCPCIVCESCKGNITSPR